MRARSVDGTVAGLLLAPALIGGLYALAALVLEGGDVPADSDYVALSDALDGASFDPAQDRVAILPPWSLRPLVVFKRFPWISADALHERPAHRLRDLYLIVEPDGEDDLEAAEQRWGPSELVAQSGPVQLLKLGTGKRTVVDDLSARLKSATVRLSRGGNVTPCDQPHGDGFRCKGRKGWQRVSRARKLVSENGDVVVWAHPPPRGERLEITWPDVRLDDELVIRTGATRTGANWAVAAVRLRVRIGEEEVANLEREPAFGLQTHHVDTKALSGQRQPVTFWIDTRNNSKNHFTFDAFTAGTKR